MRLFAWLGGRTFASLRNHRNFRLYFFSHAVSFSGTWMQQIAAYWLVLELTGSPLAVGSLALAQALPVTLFGLFVGSVIDRFDVRRILLVTESLLSLGAATLAVLTLTGAVELWHVYVIAIFQGLVLVLDNPSRHTLVFRIVGEGDLPNAVALSSALGTMARIVGPALGGLVVALAGTGVAFAVNSLSYLAVVVALLAMREPAPVRPAGGADRVSQEHQGDALVRPPVAPGRGRVLRGARAEHRLVQLRRAAAAAWPGGRSTPTRTCSA